MIEVHIKVQLDEIGPGVNVYVNGTNVGNAKEVFSSLLNSEKDSGVNMHHVTLEEREEVTGTFAPKKTNEMFESTYVDPDAEPTNTEDEQSN